MIFTTSWDDGALQDLRLMELLIKYSIPATFYIPVKNNERSVISDFEKKMISEKFEIGAHTFNHVVMSNLSEKQADCEFKNGKDYLENLLGSKIEAFCFPRGKFSKQNLSHLKKHGYLFARSTKLLNYFTNDIVDSILFHTSSQFYPHSKLVLYRHLLKNLKFRINKFQKVLQSESPYSANLHSSEITSYSYDCFHLWGHSWELDQFNLWYDLEEYFKFIYELRDYFDFLNNTDAWNKLNTNIL